MRPPGTAREGEGAAVGVVGEVPGAVIHAHLQVGFLGHPLQAARRCRAPRHFWLHGREAVVVEGDGERLVAQLVAASGERRAGGPCEIIPPRPRSPGDARIILPGRRGHRYTRMAKVCWPIVGQPHERVAKAANVRSRTQNASTQKAYTQAPTRHRLCFACICAGHIGSPRIQFNVM